MDPLAQLHDIQTPDGVNWWPLAWGWWVLAIVVVAVICMLTYSIIRHIRFNRARRQAIKLHSALAIDEQYPAQANQLLKRVTLHYFDNGLTASVYGKDWIDLLQGCLSPAQQAKTTSGFELLLQSSYQAAALSNEQLSHIQQAVNVWLKHAKLNRAPNVNVSAEVSPNV